MRILFFGDSIGWGAWDEKGGWFERLRLEYDAATRQRTAPSSYPEFYNLSSSGDTSEHILARIESGIVGFAIDRDEPCAIIIAVGTNDSWIFNGQPHVNLEKYHDNLNQIIGV
jgi:lysophospholipase L1-like esterase